MLALVLERQCELLQGRVHAVGERRQLRGCLAAQGSAQPLEKPRVAEGGASRHEQRSAAVRPAAQQLLGVGDIAVCDNGDGDGAHDLADGVPVCAAGIEHGLRAAVDRDGGCTVFLRRAGQRDGARAAPVPAKAGLYGHGDGNGVRHGADDAPGQRDVAHEGAAVAVVGDLRHGAAHIDVQKVAPADADGDLRGLGHHGRVVAEDLRAAQRALVPAKQAAALAVLIDERAGGDHLRYGHVRAMLRADRAEGVVRYAGHRCEKKRRIAGKQLHGSIPPAPYCTIKREKKQLCPFVFLSGRRSLRAAPHHSARAFG